MQTNWYVIAGAPRSGKTPVLNALSLAGYSTKPEVARHVIDEGYSQGKTQEEIRGDRVRFEDEVHSIKMSLEDSLNPEDLVFLDRGLPEDVAYYKFYGADFSLAMRACGKRRYKGVFILDPLAYEKDEARTESHEEAAILDKLIRESYVQAGYSAIVVPVMPISKRVSFILKKI